MSTERGKLSTESSLLSKWAHSGGSLYTTGLSSGSLGLGELGKSGDKKSDPSRKRKGNVGADAKECVKKSSKYDTGLMLTSTLGSPLTTELNTKLSLSSSLKSSSYLSSLKSGSGLLSVSLRPSLLTSSGGTESLGYGCQTSSFLSSGVGSKIRSGSSRTKIGFSQSGLLGSSLQRTQSRDSSDSGQKHCSKGSKIKSKKLKEISSDIYSMHKIPQPDYDLQIGSDDRGLEVMKFLPPDKDLMVSTHLARPLHDVGGMKLAFINAVSSSLICQPDFKDVKNSARIDLMTMSERVIMYDPEFVLKVALYTRKELNIRTTTNFILALAANVKSCRPYLRKYFSMSIALPSDWIEVAEIYQAFHDKNIQFGSLPAALRRAMVAKFPEFDKYQLAKYNKDSSRKKKDKGKKKQETTKFNRGRPYGRRAGQKRPLLDSDSSSDSDSDEEYAKKPKRQVSGVSYDEDSVSEEELQQKTFTLKQLIRKLHIQEPVEHVMCLIGKKYPSTLEEFYATRLPGMFEEEKAGKRMKLPIPETWETQVSMKGNKASTWEELIDHKKLPFMAMLRNIRNLIKAGISPKHHSSIIWRLTNEKQVINSKQFPFRFFSAYEALKQLENDYEKNQRDLVTNAESAATQFVIRGRGHGRGRGGRGGGQGRGGRGRAISGENWWLLKKEKKKELAQKQEVPYDQRLLEKYKKALDTAVKIATVYNVQPIKGRTIIFCDIGSSMAVPCTAARGLGKPRLMTEVAVLLGLMCKYSCEECDLIIYDDTKYTSVDITKGTILDNMETVLTTSLSKNTKALTQGLPYDALVEVLRDRIQVDNLIILSQGITPEKDAGKVLSDFLKIYRRLVNPNLLFVSVSFSGKNCGFSENVKPEHDNDIYISGYSDQILRFIAERGDGGQLMHVEKIDESYNLKSLSAIGMENIPKPELKISPETLRPISAQMPRWRTIRVFISSTFRDMHGERDLLTRFVFPELRERGRKHFINIYEVDLRWGVTEEETKQNRTLDLCLQEVSKCQFFLGILGNRYGWVPDSYEVPDTHEFDAVKEYPPGCSVTELEMHFGALSCVEKVQERAFFYIRDDTFEKDVPNEFVTDFLPENDKSQEKMLKLKERVQSSGLEVFDGYPCWWGGVLDMKPIVAGLNQFGMRVLNNLWTSIQKYYPDEDAVLDEDTHITKLHRAFIESRRAQFIGRKALIKQCMKKIVEIPSGIIALAGKSGTGKSSLVSALVHEYIESKHCNSASTVLVHMVGAASGSTNIVATLRRLCYELNRTFGLQAIVPEDYKNLIVKFGELLEESARLCGSSLVVVMDGLDLMEDTHQPYNMEWLPNPVPENVVFILSIVEGEKCHNSLKRLKVNEIVIGGLDMFDKAEVVRTSLATHRKALSESPFNNQMKLLVSKKESPNPLFLKLACDELRVFGVFEKISDKLKSLPHTMQQLLQEVLSRLEADHGRDIVATALSLMVCTRDGLQSEELWELLSWHRMLGKSKFQVKDFINLDFPTEKLIPPVTFSFLKRSIQAFLNPTETWSSRLCLAHSEIATAIRQRYLKETSSNLEQMLHKLLAGYFYRLADPNKNGTWDSNNSRAFSELPYHLACSGSFCELEEVLCNLSFIHTKCQLGMAPLLMDDFVAKGASNRYLEKEHGRFLMLPKVREYKFFVSRNLHILTSHPALTWQQAINEPSSSIPAKDVQNLRNAKEVDGNFMEWNNKPSQTDPCIMTISNLPQAATSVAVSADSRYFATGGLDCLVRLYDLATGKELRTFRGHADAIADVCFAGKGTLCSASHDKTISLWHVEDGHRIAVLKGHGRRVNSCASDLSGKLVASAGWDCQVKIWNTNSGESVCYLDVGSPVNCVDFHPDGQLIVTGSWDSNIKIWDVFHKTRKAVLRGHSSSVRDVAYSPSGRHIASASIDGDVKIWSATNGSQVGTIRGHALPINKLIFSPTGKELITVSDDHKVKMWSGHLGVPLHCLGSVKNGAVTSVALSPTGETLAAGYHEGHTRIFDVNTGLQLVEVRHHSACVRAITFTKDGEYILTGSDDCNVLLLNSASGAKLASLEGHTKPILSVTTTTKYIATTSEDFTCCVFQQAKDCQKIKRPSPQAVLKGHVAPVTSCSFNNSGEKLATASRDAAIMIWDMFTVLLDPDAKPEKVLHDCHSDWINDCKWSNIGDFLVTASNDFNLKVWDVKTGVEKNKLTGHMSAVNSVAYEYGCIVSACSDGSVKVWSHKGTEITTLCGHTQRVNSCDILVKVKQEEEEDEDETMDWAASSDWQTEPIRAKKPAKPIVKMDDVLVATCGDDGLIRLWKPLQANELACLAGHSDRVLSVATDKVGTVCSCSLDRSLRFWKPQLSEERVLGRHDADITFTICSADGTTSLSGSRDGVVKVWCSNKENSLMLECVYGFKAHEKSVNSACFLNRNGSKFVTASDDGTMILWDVLQKKESLMVKKGRKYITESPITCLVWNEYIPSKSGHIFFSADWKGSVKVWNTDFPEHVGVSHRYITKHGFYKDWVLKMAFSAEDLTQLLMTGTDGKVVVLDVAGVLTGKKDPPKVLDTLIVKSNEIDMQVPLHKQTANWILDVTRCGKSVFCGDSKGQITLTSLKEGLFGSVKQLKLHGEAVTGVVVTGHAVVTCSLDQTIKVWNGDMSQVGQFFCPAPVTSMCQITPHCASTHSLRLMCGDQLGNVHLLTWRQ